MDNEGAENPFLTITTSAVYSLVHKSIGGKEFESKCYNGKTNELLYNMLTSAAEQVTSHLF